ncbi:hypothetical protein [Candidatus Spyradosoma sp. SGI.093]|uniref:hypothetical protein n=1 Tax=Candidatus Spyradosoma sp. SGI.093 TaxID=3420583 RepID=UPI003D06A79F
MKNDDYTYLHHAKKKAEAPLKNHENVPKKKDESETGMGCLGCSSFSWGLILYWFICRGGLELIEKYIRGHIQ